MILDAEAVNWTISPIDPPDTPKKYDMTALTTQEQQEIDFPILVGKIH